MNSKPKKIDPSENEKAMCSFRTIFKSSDTFSNPFKSVIEEKIILYNELYRLDEDHYHALGNSALDIYDSSAAYISLVEDFMNDDYSHKQFWIIDLLSYPYEDLINQHDGWIPIAENAIFPSYGKWGIVFSKYGHSILGGSRSFISSLRNQIPSLNDQVYDFLAEVRNEINQNTDTQKYFKKWLPQLLSSIYGEDQSMKMQKRVGLELPPF